MPRIAALCLSLVLALALAAPALAKPRTHVVAAGHTLGRIAKRYNVSIDDLCKANGITRRDPIKPGQRLVIPSEDGSTPPPNNDPPEDKPAAKAPEPQRKKEAEADSEDGKIRRLGNDGLRVIDLPGAGPAYFYEPVGPGRLGMRPLFIYMHGRGGNPGHDCRRWAPVVRRLGWLVCPSGPGARGDGRGWNNNWALGQRTALAVVKGFRGQFGRRVQLYGNTLIGFSEGAYVTMNVGVREPRTFNRLLILAGKTSYLGGPGLDALAKSKSRLRRVYLITGEQDGVIAGTHQLRDVLKKHSIPTRISTPADMGHEVALERKQSMYRAALVWLERGTTKQARSKSVARSSKKQSARKH
jgi:hypothetical protein